MCLNQICILATVCCWAYWACNDIQQIGRHQVSCKCSFLEIYNENITDLLSASEAHLQIREDAARGVYVENLCEEEVSSGAAHFQLACVMHAKLRTS